MKKFIIALVLISTTLTSVSPAFALSASEMSKLNSLLQKRSLEVLGNEMPTDLPYDKHYDTGTKEVPPPNCKNAKVVKRELDPATGRTFARWWCSNPI